MKYIEVCKGVNDRNKFQLVGTIKPEPRDYPLYISLFPFDNSIVEYVKLNGTIKGHKGKHYCDYILIDIDYENDPNESRLSAIQLIERLNTEFGISPDELFIWFSGNKGFHIALVSKIYGQLDPSETIASDIKKFIEKYFGDIKHVDYKIYENHRIIRVENSQHEKTTLYKVQLSFDELKSDFVNIRRLAKEPREFKRKLTYSEIRYNDGFSRALKSNKTFIENNVSHEDGFFLPTLKGNRNNQLFKQACMLFNTSDLHFKSIQEIIISINLASGEPLPDHEVNSILNSASSRSIRKKEENESLRLKTLIDIMPEWLEYISDEKHKISLLFDSLNNEFRGKLRGKFGIIIGYGGSKKSLLSQNIVYDNAVRLNNKTIYSNMEMSNAVLFERFLDIAIDGSYTLPSYEIEQLYKDGKNVEPHIKQAIYETLSDRIIICDNSGMTSERYRQAIKEINEPVDIIIVDGFSMMGGSGTELELANKHSKELKELAKDENVFVLGIVHASKGETLESRNLTRKARASEKIMDNCDFAITTSLIAEKGKKDHFEQRKGIYQLWNKRGSGVTIEKAFEFGMKNMRIFESVHSDEVEIDEAL